jgi:hypothetical protein
MFPGVKDTTKAKLTAEVLLWGLAPMQSLCQHEWWCSKPNWMLLTELRLDAAAGLFSSSQPFGLLHGTCLSCPPMVLQ